LERPVMLGVDYTRYFTLRFSVTDVGRVY
jgi:hypothetical protein